MYFKYFVYSLEMTLFGCSHFLCRFLVELAPPFEGGARKHQVRFHGRPQEAVEASDYGRSRKCSFFVDSF